ncbi:MAG: KpsF/GutQ family sugar-phosphate isomerase [Acidiferrobacterales bacterium]|jgi:arabinose-5-phosphate isomerase|nr:KpsF/GutQ family sugar-phosphate isomerase [Acidiferrobacterales bacterium]
MTHAPFQELGRNVITLEAEAVAALAERIDESFVHACETLLGCRGRVVVVGMGKSGHIGGKIAATLASTGTPAFFVHPGEASHGDLGMITTDDVVLAISNSGTTTEILTILPIIKRMGVKLISMTGNVNSELGQQSDVTLDIGVEKEACPLNLAPTASTTVTLAMGDALAVALLKSRGFTEEDFARSHPGGRLGRRLLLYVKDIMHSGDQLPVVNEDTSLRDALLVMSGKGLGMTAVVNVKQQLVGIYTDGDLRRTLEQGVDVYSASIHEVMTANPVTTHEDRLAAEAVQLMRDKKINGLFVVDNDNHVLGALNMQDLLREGVV